MVVFSGAPDRIRTCDLLIRSQTLYPTELRAQNVLAEGEGFEPSEGGKAFNRLAGGSFRPLKHPSIHKTNCTTQTKACQYAFCSLSLEFFRQKIKKNWEGTTF